MIPKGATHISENLKSVSAEKNEINLESGKVLQYDALVLSVGIELAFDKVEGEYTCKNGRVFGKNQ